MSAVFARAHNYFDAQFRIELAMDAAEAMGATLTCVACGSCGAVYPRTCTPDREFYPNARGAIGYSLCDACIAVLRSRDPEEVLTAIDRAIFEGKAWDLPIVDHVEPHDADDERDDWDEVLP